MESDRKRIGVVGAGTMGSGIALSALYSGFDVVLQDAFENAITKGEKYIDSFLEKKGKQKLKSRLTLTKEMGALSDCEIVIEAAIEDLQVKQKLFVELEKVCATDAILASNTSTLSVTAIAAACQQPQRIAGMHFFNPAPVLPLVEVVRAAESSQETIESLVTFSTDLGKTPVEVSDSPGFIVNRVARPYYGEALRILGERAGTVEQIDRIVELGGSFRMGSFRLMDLIGIDINAGAMRSMYEQTFGEPRYRPHPLQMQKLAQGALGRKTGQGFYRYEDDSKQATQEHRTESVQAEGDVWLSEGSWAPSLEERLRSKGYATHKSGASQKPEAVFVRGGRNEDVLVEVQSILESAPEGVPIFVQTADVALSEYLEQGLDERIIGFDGLFVTDEFISLQSHEWISEKVKENAENWLTQSGLKFEWLSESPALVLPRIVAQLVNEACFALQDGVADKETIDTAMKLGVNYPLGPFEWGAKLGYEKVLAILDHLHSEFHEERYRASYLLRNWVRTEVTKR
jgi:3-hydroxybutyryl-CoA dehydrogenase